MLRIGVLSSKNGVRRTPTLSPHAGRGESSIPPRDSGEGGPRCAAARWEGRRRRRVLGRHYCSTAACPLHHAEPVIGPATSGRTRWRGPPPPHFVRGRISATVLATRARPSYAYAIRKIDPRSRIASRLRRRWNRLSARSCPTNKRKACSPDERSDIRGRSTSLNAAPGYRFAHPGYQEREAERRQAHQSKPPRLTGAARAKRRALACRRSTTALAAATERHSSAPAPRFLGPGRSARPRWFERSCTFFAGVTRSFLSQSSEFFTRRPVIVPAGRILPKPPGSGGDEPPPAGTAPAPPAGVAGCRPSRERDRNL